MGDRAVITFKEKYVTESKTIVSYTPGIYLHWAGSETLHLLEESLPHLRLGDALYSAARFCGYCHTEIPGNTGLGLYEAPDPPEFEDENAEKLWWSQDYGPGDRGVFVVDIDALEVKNYQLWVPALQIFYEPEITQLSMERVGKG